jgi:hypothetical protein
VPLLRRANGGKWEGSRCALASPSRDGEARIEVSRPRWTCRECGVQISLHLSRALRSAFWEAMSFYLRLLERFFCLGQPLFYRSFLFSHVP